ncbi:hypothetical protein [Streptomyces decoyicus]|uniref:hypothetical protein n=1 Tax=Streptomyces decoyicus TaxID=249567 RepID=UPI002F910630
MRKRPAPEQVEQQSEQELCDVVLCFTGDITDYWSFTQVRDYLFILPGLTDPALRLYCILRSMITEANKHRPGAGLRRMTIDQLCYLMAGVNGNAGKPVSVSSMYELLKILERLRLVVPRDVTESEGASQLKGKQKAVYGILRGFTIKDLPPAVQDGWRNAWDKLDAYRPDWRENPVELPTHLTAFDIDGEGHRVAQVWTGSTTDVEAFQNSGTGSDSTPGEAPNQDPFQDSGTPFQDSGTALQDPGTDSPSTCENGLPKEGSQRSSSLSAADELEAEAVKDEREAATPKDKLAPDAVPNQRDGGQDDADRIAAAWGEALAKSGPAPSRQAEGAVRREAARLLADGEAADYLTAAVVDMAHRNPSFRSLSKHLEHYTPKPAGGKHERCPEHPRHLRGRCLECALTIPA